MVRHEEPENEPPQENRTKKGRPIQNPQGHWTSTYQLDLPKSWKIHNVFHATLLRQYKETEVYGANFPKPPPELIKGEETYEIDSMLRDRRRGQGYQYYVKWKGYPISEASWEPEEMFSDDGDLLIHYKERHQLLNRVTRQKELSYQLS